MPPSTFSIVFFLITFLSLFTTIDARRFGFLYLCIGSGCEGWQVALTILSIVVAFLGCCLCACCSKKHEEEERRRKEIAEITMQRRPQKYDEEDIM